MAEDKDKKKDSVFKPESTRNYDTFTINDDPENIKNLGLAEPQFQARDPESTQEKLPYPKSVFFIVTNEFCERFSYYGMKAVLTIYLTNVLNFSEDTATVIYHVFSMCAYFTPLLGAMLADSFLGKFKTIFYLSIVYCAGNIVLSLAATPPLVGDSTDLAMPLSMLGLALIALGTGGIKPCVAAFGGDQFVLPQQAAQLATFFSFFYMAINSGSLISTFVTPIMRSDVQCFGDDSCYSLAFAVPAALMIVALLVFLAGKFMYRETKPAGNVVVKLVKCISHALSRKGKNTPRTHWLDHADDEYEPRFIEDVKIVLRVLVLYLPLPVFWALFDQQGSRWTLQATRMDGVVGGGFTIKPDQVQVLNPLLILIFIPLFDNLIYPLLGKCNLLKKPLQRLTMGGILAGIAFIISGVLELELEKTYPTRLVESQANLNFINTLPCPIFLNMGSGDIKLEAKFGSKVFEAVEAGNYNLHLKDVAPGIGKGIQMTVDGDCAAIFTMDADAAINFSAKKSPAELDEQHGTEERERGGGFTYMITWDDQNKIKLAYGPRSDDREKPKEGNPKVKFLVGGEYFEEKKPGIPSGQLSVWVTGEESEEEFIIYRNETVDGSVGLASRTIELEPIPYKIKLVYGASDEDEMESVTVPFGGEFDFKLGASYIISISRKEEYPLEAIIGPENALNPVGDFNETSSYIVSQHTITQPSTLHMFWLLPQYIIITAGEIMFSITGLEFSYSQAPVTMKSVMQSAWLLTVAFGNLIVVIIAEAKFFQEQSKEFFLFAGLMFVDMMLFAFLAYRYVPAQLEDPSKKKDDD